MFKREVLCTTLQAEFNITAYVMTLHYCVATLLSHVSTIKYDKKHSNVEFQDKLKCYYNG